MFIRQIQYLLALSKTGHFGRAAEICHVSQPGLSTAIQHLEEELGFTIVRRVQRSQGFTPGGDRVPGCPVNCESVWRIRLQESLPVNWLVSGRADQFIRVKLGKNIDSGTS